jgi:hypothetical protein
MRKKRVYAQEFCDQYTRGRARVMGYYLEVAAGEPTGNVGRDDLLERDLP